MSEPKKHRTREEIVALNEKYGLNEKPKPFQVATLADFERIAYDGPY